MPLDPEVLLSCVHFYSMIGERKKSRFYDRLFVHMMKRSIRNSRLDSQSTLE